MDVDKLFFRSLFKNLFSLPCLVEFWDGEVVQYGEGDPRFHIIMRKPIPKSEIVEDPSLAFGEAYMHGHIEIKGSVRDVMDSLFNNKDSFVYKNPVYLKMVKFMAKANGVRKSKENIQFHYDIGNDFYQLWLDETMTYSCAYFRSPEDTLTQAQKNKIDHILVKLNLQAGQNLLDIGCGWGELILTAAREYRVKALGITLSQEQYDKVRFKIDHENLSELVDVQLLDYREIGNRVFDRVVSVGMIEHVGKEHLDEYFSTVQHLLNDGGISLLHCITGKDGSGTNSWINAYIFPGGYIPSVPELIRHMEDDGFSLYDVESLRNHYTRTLEHWTQNFEQALPLVRETKDETFIRMWRLYLNSCAASFHSGNIDLHQLLFSKGPHNSLPWTRNYMYHLM
ncbi:MAG: cyclopropane-fatty-acyl-phospholipid synthase [Desulfosporosinus sp.]|nr:cyclopropane-fatty-acyl-phospholipid synthase [Desulfosporosinus sp.]